jgi:hypothetical protein
MKGRWAIVGAVTILAVVTTPADSQSIPHKYQFAEIVEAAGVAADKCPGLHLIDANAEAATTDSGADEDDIYSPEYEFWSKRGKATAQEGFLKDPVHWCNRIWQYLGPNHPPMVHRTLLTKD